MQRFLSDTDYDKQIKGEILRLLDGSTPALQDNYKLLGAEQAAIDQIKNWLASRYDCNAIFQNSHSGDSSRDQFIVMIVIDLTLYHLYSQTGHKDIPKHRNDRYQDALDWLKLAAKGEISTNLPTAITDDIPGEIRIWSKAQENHVW